MRITNEILMKLNRLVRIHIFSKQKFIAYMFNVKAIYPPNIQSYCEWGTILLRLILKRYVFPGSRILEIGTGAHAILPIFIKKHFPDSSIIATDIVPDRISTAGETIAHNNCDIISRVTDMFDGIEESFDLVLFNPPTIPSGELEASGYQLSGYPGIGARRCWSGDGGLDGLDIIRSFLTGLGDHLTDHGRAILTANPMRCSKTHFRSLCHSESLKIERTLSFPGIVTAFIIQRGPPVPCEV